MKAGSKMLAPILIIALILFLIISSNKGPKKVDVSDIETMRKPSGIDNIKVESEGNTRKITITIDNEGIEKAKENAETVFESIKKENGIVFMVEILDHDGKVLEMGIATIGAENIEWY